MNSPDTPASQSSGRRVIGFVNRKALLADLACVLVMVVMGTRNHDTDTGLGGVIAVAGPFWIAALLAHLSPATRGTTTSMRSGAIIWVGTVSLGMVLRHFVWDRGTAVAFIIVASAFLGLTMLGWRTVYERRSVA